MEEFQETSKTELVEFSDLKPYLRGIARQMRYFVFKEADGTKSPFNDPSLNQLTEFSEGRIVNGQMDGYNRLFYFIDEIVHLGWF